MGAYGRNLEKKAVKRLAPLSVLGQMAFEINNRKVNSIELWQYLVSQLQSMGVVNFLNFGDMELIIKFAMDELSIDKDDPLILGIVASGRIIFIEKQDEFREKICELENIIKVIEQNIPRKAA